MQVIRYGGAYTDALSYPLPRGGKGHSSSHPWFTVHCNLQNRARLTKCRCSSAKACKPIRKLVPSLADSLSLFTTQKLPLNFNVSLVCSWLVLLLQPRGVDDK